MNPLNRLVVAAIPFVPRAIVRRFSAPYIAGAELGDAVRAVGEMNREGACATLDVLGEYITKQEEAWAAARVYKEVLDAIVANRLDANISIKLTQMGLKLDLALCREVVAWLVGEARQHGVFVRIDMEDSTCTTDTITVFRAMKDEFDNVGIVVQSCLRRTLADVQALAALKTSFRLCKGIYVEPRPISWRDPEIIRSNYVLLLEEMFRAGCRVGIATHDARLVWSALALIHRMGVPPDGYEFQMLLGVDPELRRIILKEGHRLRVYVPFGRHWYAYSVRRLKENPEIAGYVLKGLLGRA